MTKPSANPVVVEVLRAGEVESRHRGAAVIMSSDGTIVESWGDCNALMFPRSAYKMLQALPLVESGAAEAFQLTNKELALACASHSSEPRHIDAVRAWLGKINCNETDLACGGHRPSHEESADQAVRDGISLGQVYNNCSGKHTGFLTMARHLDVPINGYEQVDHPVQQGAIAAISEMSDVRPQDMVVGVDGCSAPALAMPLASLARAYARLADPDALGEARGQAARTLFHAATNEPFYVAGSEQASKLLMEQAKGRASVKTGAEAVFTAVIPDQKIGIALKIDDGSSRASECLIAALLVRLGIIEAEAPEVRTFLNPTLRNRAGLDVGEIRPVSIFS